MNCKNCDFNLNSWTAVYLPCSQNALIGILNVCSRYAVISYRQVHVLLELVIVNTSKTYQGLDYPSSASIQCCYYWRRGPNAPLILASLDPGVYNRVDISNYT